MIIYELINSLLPFNGIRLSEKGPGFSMGLIIILSVLWQIARGYLLSNSGINHKLEDKINKIGSKEA